MKTVKAVIFFDVSYQGYLCSIGSQ